MKTMRFFIGSLCCCLLLMSCSKENLTSDDTTQPEALTVDGAACFDPDAVDPFRMCQDDYTPVCACGVATFTSPCEAEKMGFTNYTYGACTSKACQSEAVKTLAEKSGSQCLAIYDPVCGCNGKTYGNSCYAFHDGVTVYTRGECGSIIAK